MDLIDKKILCELDLDCRTPHSKIARKLKVGRNIVSYRIKSLEEKGIISGYICSLNLGLIGYKTYKINLRIHGSRRSESDFIKHIIADSSVIHCMKTEGAFDYSVTLAVRNIMALDQFLMDMKNRFTDLIQDYHVSIVIYSKVFKSDKLLLDAKHKMPKIEKYSGEAKRIVLDDKDKLILRALSQSANQSIVALAASTSLSVDIVKYRLRQLGKTIINSNRAIFDFDKLGYYHYVFLLRIRQSTKADEERLVSWCSMKRNVLYCTKRIGNYDFTINVAITDIQDFNAFLAELKEQFGGIIDSYETILNSRMLKLNYVPF